MLKLKKMNVMKNSDKALFCVNLLKGINKTTKEISKFKVRKTKKKGDRNSNFRDRKYFLF